MIRIKEISIVLAGLIYVASATAQTSAEATAVESSEATIEAEVIKETPEAASASASNTNSNAAGATQEVYVIQQPTAAATSSNVVAQPTTVVEASPLVPSRAEEIRNMRQRAEVETEQKIVEKLEQSRLQDEKKRMDRIFGNKLDNTQEETVAAPKEEQPQPQQVIVVQPQQPVAPVAPVKSEEELKAEITESIKADLNKVKEEEKPEARKFSIGASLGTVEYDAQNVGSDFAGGVVLTWDLGNRMILDGGFIYSRHIVDEDVFSYQDMDQYNWNLGLKYAFLNSKITPVAGGVVSYTRRSYSVPYYSYGPEFSSDAIDVGLVVGVDFKLNDNVALGIDYRRMMNMEARYSDEDLFNRPIFASYYPGYTPIEEVDYDMLNFALRFQF